MRTLPLPAAHNARQNVRLLGLLGPGGFLAVKALYGLLRHPAAKCRALARLRALERAAVIGDEAYLRERRDWRRQFRRLLLTTNRPRAMTLIESFYTARIEQRRDVVPPLGGDANAPILLCAVKNDLVRMQAVLAHYRALGVARFAVVDNGSTDGTLEYLLAQPDADVFQTDAAFGSVQKAGWLNRLIAHYGRARWYLWIDADELLSYPRMETQNLSALTRALTARGACKLRTLMLDMYPTGALLDPARRDEDFLKDSVLFDADSDDYAFYPAISRLYGGMRARVFGLTDVTLSKVTLLRGDRVLLTGAHDVYPQSEDYSGAFYGALRHYKFLPRDLEKYRAIAAGGAYAGGSAEYKRYLAAFAETPGLSAACPESAVYAGSGSLDALPFVRDPFGTD